MLWLLIFLSVRQNVASDRLKGKVKVLLFYVTDSSQIWLTNLLWPTIRAFYCPFSTIAPIFSYLKLHKKERNWKKDLRSHLGMELNLNPSAEIGTDWANPCGSLRSCGASDKSNGVLDRQRLSGLSLSTSLSPFSATALPYIHAQTALDSAAE